MRHAKIDLSPILSQNRVPSILFGVLGTVLILTLVRFEIGDHS